MLSKLPLMLVSDTGYSTQRGQNGRRHRCNDLHNPLKSLFLFHNRLIDLMVLKFRGGALFHHRDTEDTEFI